MAHQSDSTAAPPTIVDVLTAALGYFIVFVSCSLAGYALGHPSRLPSSTEWIPFTTLWIIALPAYINRAILYEQKLDDFIGHSNNLQWLKKLSLQLPLVFLGVAGLIVTVVAWNTNLPSTESWGCILLRAIAASTPLYCLGARLSIRWPADQSLYDFRFRTLFPAFATCLPSFIFGYIGCTDNAALLVGAILVILFWSLALYLSLPKFTRWSAAFLILVVLPSVALTANQSNPVARWIHVGTFGVLMTLSMGVSESWRVTSRILNNVDYRPTLYSAQEQQYYLGGTNFATAVFLPSFLLTVLHPATTPRYLGWSTLLLVIQYFSWFAGNRNWKRSRLWPVFGVLSGLALPVIIGICTSMSVDSTWVITAKFPKTWTFIASTTPADLVLLFVFFTRRVVPILAAKDRSIMKSFLQADACLALTGAISSACGLLIVATGFILPLVSVNFTDSMEARLATLHYTYCVLAAVCALVLYLMRLFGDRTTDTMLSPSDGGTPPRAEGAVAQASALWRSTRPLSSLVPAVLAAAVVLINDMGQISLAASAGLVMGLLTMFGFVVNDIFDFKKDALAGVTRPIAMQTISRRAAAVFAAGLLIAALSIAAIISFGIVIAILTACALIAYSPFSRSVPMAKGGFTAVLACAPLWYGSSAVRVDYPWLAYAVLFIFVFGREAIMDAQEADGDAKSGVYTLAYYLGKRRTWSGGVVLMIVGAAALTLIANGPFGRVGGLITLALLATVLLWPGLNSANRIQLSRLAMIAGAVALATAAG